MKKLYFLLILCVVTCVFLFVGCDKNAPETINSPSIVDNVESLDDNVGLIEERKIIYTASAKINTNNLEDTVASIKSNLNEDEWFDQETISKKSAYLVARVKSERLDTFISSISNSGTVSDYNKTATDISLNYQDSTSRIESLEAEKARLNALYPEASMSDMITINARLSQLNNELGTLQGTINNYDRLIDYSEVTLNIYELETKPDISYGQRIKDTFKNAWVSLGKFFEWLFLTLVAIFPFALVIIPVGVGIMFLNSFLKKKRKKKLSKKKDNNELSRLE